MKNVLIVDDNNDDSLIMKNKLRDLGANIQSESGCLSAICRVGRETFDLVIVDYYLGYLDAQSLIGFLKEKGENFIVVSGIREEEFYRKEDRDIIFISKDKLEELAPIVSFLLMAKKKYERKSFE